MFFYGTNSRTSIKHRCVTHFSRRIFIDREILNPKFSIRNFQSQIRNPKSEIRICNLKSPISIRPNFAVMKPVLIYCYDAYCGWCYGFSPIIKIIAEEYKDQLEQDVLSGGMILPEKPVHIGATAGYISKAYTTVEELSGIKFGQDYLWHVFNPDQSDWYPNSEKPAIAMCIFKEYYPERVIEFASDLQYSLHYEGRDLTDNEAYRHLLEKYSIQAERFYEKLASEEYKEKAYYEFQLCKQLQVTGYPTAFIQTGELQFKMIARGYTDYETLKSRVDAVLASVE
jgi:putative protein-disulfide isomerase